MSPSLPGVQGGAGVESKSHDKREVADGKKRQEIPRSGEVG